MCHYPTRSGNPERKNRLDAGSAPSAVLISRVVTATVATPRKDELVSALAQQRGMTMALPQLTTTQGDTQILLNFCVTLASWIDIQVRS